MHTVVKKLEESAQLGVTIQCVHIVKAFACYFEERTFIL